MVDLGYAYAIPVGDQVSIVPRLGATAIGALGEGGGGVAAGFVVGAGFVVIPASGLGFRADLNYRSLTASYDSDDLWSVSIGMVWPGKDKRRTSD